MFGSVLGACDGSLHLVEQGQPITDIARLALGCQIGKDQTGGGFGDEAGLPATLRRAIALPFHHGGNGRIVGIDHFTVAEFLALGEAFGLGADVRMGTHCRGELTGKPFALPIMPNRRLRKTLVGLLAIPVDRFSQSQEPWFRVAHERDEDATLASTTAAKTAHHFFEFLPEVVGVVVERGRPATALLSDVRNEFEAFFWALYSVVASVTR